MIVTMLRLYFGFFLLQSFLLLESHLLCVPLSPLF